MFTTQSTSASHADPFSDSKFEGMTANERLKLLCEAALASDIDDLDLGDGRTVKVIDIMSLRGSDRNMAEAALLRVVEPSDLLDYLDKKKKELMEEDLDDEEEVKAEQEQQEEENNKRSERNSEEVEDNEISALDRPSVKKSLDTISPDEFTCDAVFQCNPHNRSEAQTLAKFIQGENKKKRILEDLI